jgi:hypothetical protein
MYLKGHAVFLEDNNKSTTIEHVAFIHSPRKDLRKKKKKKKTLIKHFNEQDLLFNYKIKIKKNHLILYKIILSDFFFLLNL